MNDDLKTLSTETTAAAAPKTREDKLRAEYEKLATRIHADTVKANSIAQELHEIAALAAVGEGSTVVVTVGKGEAAKEVTANVIGVRLEDDGSKTYKVQYGSGFDADVAVVKGNKLKLPQVSQDTGTSDGADQAAA